MKILVGRVLRERPGVLGATVRVSAKTALLKLEGSAKVGERYPVRDDGVESPRLRWRRVVTRHDAGGAKTAELRAMLTRVVTACDERDTCQVCRCLQRARAAPHALRGARDAGRSSDEESHNACEDWAADAQRCPRPPRRRGSA